MLRGRLICGLIPTKASRPGELLARLPERELADLIYQFGEERFSRRIARRIVEQRLQRPIETAAELAQLRAALRAAVG